MKYEASYINSIKCDCVRKLYLSSIVYSCSFCLSDDAKYREKNGDEN